MKPSREHDTDARDRLLTAATAICAERGFKNASVRMICERAGANLAMVNYYFGSKDELYLAVIRRASELGFVEQLIPPSDSGLSPRQRLHYMVRQLLASLLLDGEKSDVAKLITWEQVDPTPALAVIVDTLARPMHQAMCALVAELAARPLSETEVRMHTLSVLSQIVFYGHSRPLNELLVPQLRYDEASIETLATHITAFSLRGIGVPG
jgi:AcrR family transcriptional regulator